MTVKAALSLKKRMERFLEVISEKEKTKNKKLQGQIEFLKKYLGTFGDGSGGLRDQSDLDFQTYFNFKLNGVGA